MLTARTTDGQGATTTSAARTIIVDAAPTVSLAATPLNAVAPASVTLTATASDADGTIAQVEFLQGAAVVATLSAPPYVTTVNNLGAGSYVFTARATDNATLTTTSAPVTVTVTANQASTVSITTPVHNAVCVAPATMNNPGWSHLTRAQGGRSRFDRCPPRVPLPAPIPPQRTMR